MAEPLTIELSAGPFAGTARLTGLPVSLSGSARLDVEVTGPAGFRCGWDGPVLAEPTRADWLAEPAGAPAVAPAGEGREVWRASYRLEPFRPGRTELLIAPLTVRTLDRFDPYSLRFPPVPAEVTTSVARVAPELLRPLTPIEPAPPPPAEVPSGFHWPYAAGAGLAAVLLAAAVLLRRRPRSSADGGWLGRELAELRGLCASGRAGEVADRLDRLARQVCERRTGALAGSRTRQELLGLLEEVGEPARAGLAELLAECERARFSGVEPSVPVAEALIGRAEALFAEGESGGGRKWEVRVKSAGPASRSD